MIDATHDAERGSWVSSARGHADFPLQNLPLGIFAPRGATPRGGVAIGDEILDIGGLAERGLLRDDARSAAIAAGGPLLNDFLDMGARYRRALRSAVSELLSATSARADVEPLLHAASTCSLHTPAAIGDFTDFYAGIHHAEAVGHLFRPDAPLLPNYKHVPVAYHGRASSVQVSGTSLRRPRGQIKLGAEAPRYQATDRLDFELELGIWIGPHTLLAETVPIARAQEHVAGYCLLNDWSARDVQTWEYQPLGPFLAKNFLTSISPWIVTPEALAPFRIAQAPRPAGDPRPLPYLWSDTDQASGALDIELEVWLRTDTMRRHGAAPAPLSRSNTRHLYWTAAQMLTHHTSGGCNLRAGDLFGSGTVSAPGGAGSLLELSRGGARPVQLPNGETRAFLRDGDEVILTARAQRPGFASIGFGECRGVIAAA